jgi:hypothetical protein
VSGTEEAPEPGSEPSSEGPRAKDLDALLGEIGETLGDPEELPSLERQPWPAWRTWALAGAIGCGIAGAAAAGNVFTGQGPTFAYRGLPAWVWGGIDGAVIGSMSGLACALWGRVRRGALNSLQGVVLIVLLSAAALTVAFSLINFITALVADNRTFLPSWGDLPIRFWRNLIYGCALVGGLLAHVGTRGLVSRLFFSWVLCMLVYLPIALAGSKIYPYLVDVDFFWRAGFPYYLALPASWWIASRIKPDPLPVLRGDEESSDDA